jgi:hypothetical protein
MQKAAAICLALAGLAGWGGAQAQMYNCKTSSGTLYQSDRPCSATSGSNNSSAASSRNNSSGGNVTYYGPAESAARSADSSNRYRYQPPVHSASEAPPHIRFMNGRCASLHDALRTAGARGLKYETVDKMRRDYQNECSENESEARNALAREGSEKKKQQRADMVAENENKSRTAQQQQQCGEAKRVLVTKRARTDLNEGEKADLQRFEDNYRARCS